MRYNKTMRKSIWLLSLLTIFLSSSLLAAEQTIVLNFTGPLEPATYTSLTLILLGMSFMIFEMVVSSFGAIGIVGVIAFVIGSIMLFNAHDPNFHLPWALFATISIIFLIFFFMMLNLAIKSHKRKIVTGREGLIGSNGIVITVKNEKIIVSVLGEIWNAKSSSTLKAGDKIKVKNVDGLLLIVELVKLGE